MRGKIARQLRKLSEFDPNASRTSQIWEVMRKRKVMQFDSVEKKVNFVLREVPCPIVECTDAKRILYKFLKKKYNNINAEMEVVPLPTTEELNDITNKIKQDIQQRKEILSANARGGVSGPSSEDGGGNFEEGKPNAEGSVPSN